MASPEVSLILCVKNGMPYLPEALESVRRQTFRQFELIVQDSVSDDGTLDVLAAAEDIPGVSVVSELDGGVGDGYARALARCSGRVIGTIDADNLLEPDALERTVAFLADNPDIAAAYGGSYMAAEDGTVLYPWMPARFDLMHLLTMELVPPFAASFFVRDVCGDALRFDPSLKTCQDFDLWLRLSHLPIARIDAILGTTRLSPESMTRRPETYEQYIADKTAALERYLRTFQPSQIVNAVRRSALAGLYLWAADSVFDIERHVTPQFDRYVAAAVELGAGGRRLEAVVQRPERELAEAARVAEAAETVEPVPPPAVLERGPLARLVARAGRDR